jgi:hypothetical protein
MKKVFLVAACCFLTTSVAFSQTQQGQTQQILAKAKLIHGAPTTCPNDPVLSSDGTEADYDLIIPGVTSFYALNAKGGHSYSIDLWDTSDSTAGIAPVIKVTSDCSTSIAGVMDVTNIDPDLTGGFSDRVSWIQGSDQMVYISVTNPDQNNPYSYNIRVTDTTQVNPRWSTYTPFDTQWGFTNTTTSPITGTLTVIDSTGSVLATITKTYPAGLFTLVPARGNGVPVNHYGNAVFAYTGPAGAILADAFAINSANTVIVPYKFEGKHAYH